MRKPYYYLVALALLAACREANLTTQSTPATGKPARVLRFDTTFSRVAQRNRAFRYVTVLRVGRAAHTTTIPVEIDWTATQGHGCPQVASVQVYQLNGDDRRVSLVASVRRDSTCRAGLGADGRLGTATTGLALVRIGGTSKAVRFATITSCLVNALGYHDSLSYANPTAHR